MKFLSMLLISLCLVHTGVFASSGSEKEAVKRLTEDVETFRQSFFLGEGIVFPEFVKILHEEHYTRYCSSDSKCAIVQCTYVHHDVQLFAAIFLQLIEQKNPVWKLKLCAKYSEKEGSCPYREACQFRHKGADRWMLNGVQAFVFRLMSEIRLMTESRDYVSPGQKRKKVAELLGQCLRRHPPTAVLSPKSSLPPTAVLSPKSSHPPTAVLSPKSSLSPTAVLWGLMGDLDPEELEPVGGRVLIEPSRADISS